MCRYFAANNFLLPLGKKTYIMSILNLTPDSFSDGGKWNDKDIAIKKALQMVEEGADILDVGAQSTRPGYTQVSAREEIDRLKNILPKIRKKVNIPISIDTFYPEVAEYAIKEGVDIINDITGFEDERMVQLASNCSCGLIVMHNTTSEDIRAFFERKLKELTDKGIETKRICFDPGIVFSKTYEQNLHVLKNIKEFKVDICAILVGASRKRVIGAPCGNPPFCERMPGTIAAHTIATVGGADILRVHDVKESVQAAKVADAILNL